MENSIGKIINCDTKAELDFSLAPVDFHVEQSFELNIEPCLASALPVVSFHGGGSKTLSTVLIFDRDADDSVDVQKVQSFIHSLGKVSIETKSIPLSLFKMGEFTFKGYLGRIATTFGRFSATGQARQLRLEINMIAAEEDENGQK